MASGRFAVIDAHVSSKSGLASKCVKSWRRISAHLPTAAFAFQKCVAAPRSLLDIDLSGILDRLALTRVGGGLAIDDREAVAFSRKEVLLLELGEYSGDDGVADIVTLRYFVRGLREHEHIEVVYALAGMLDREWCGMSAEIVQVRDVGGEIPSFKDLARMDGVVRRVGDSSVREAWGLPEAASLGLPVESWVERSELDEDIRRAVAIWRRVHAYYMADGAGRFLVKIRIGGALDGVMDAFGACARRSFVSADSGLVVRGYSSVAGMSSRECASLYFRRVLPYLYSSCASDAVGGAKSRHDAELVYEYAPPISDWSPVVVLWFLDSFVAAGLSFQVNVEGIWFDYDQVVRRRLWMGSALYFMVR